ncbi:SlyX family protein [Pseudomonadales bacterium]|nr:SlyX family protein [Pseudomonadales bacterium]MDA9366892.1 SlyX family protein [Pseudomonadales bacterium]MDB4150217.1 SlyX family protein [Pseudomonadales bacterium]MDB9866117.1 SlyX family protein [Pseudomonadales bacterium]MDB9880000.1 SlyX family protein [Pseudomonadales bacterium]|tara:strand:- start:529 stop:735 length:207 start_codon:yes stop_codon:yes gene_type:complete
MTNHQFDGLEMKLAFQEDMIQKLDDALVSQQHQILTLQRQVQLLGNELRALDTRSLGDAAPEPPPPHY